MSPYPCTNRSTQADIELVRHLRLYDRDPASLALAVRRGRPAREPVQLSRFTTRRTSTCLQKVSMHIVPLTNMVHSRQSRVPTPERPTKVIWASVGDLDTVRAEDTVRHCRCGGGIGGCTTGQA